MALHKLKKGLDLPINGAPDQTVEAASRPSAVALLAADYPGMKPTMHVAVGDHVRRGELLFEDKKQTGVRYTAPGAGTVTGVHRGAKRAFQSVTIQLDPGEGDSARFSAHSGRHPSALTGDEVRELLIESGQWTALRARPYGRVADPEATPRSIFVTATDSDPLAPAIAPMLEGRESDLERGLAAVARLTDGPVYVCSEGLTPRSWYRCLAASRSATKSFARANTQPAAAGALTSIRARPGRPQQAGLVTSACRMSWQSEVSSATGELDVSSASSHSAGPSVRNGLDCCELVSGHGQTSLTDGELEQSL